MSKQLHLLPECYADTLLVNRLIQSTTNHKHSISKVFTALKVTFNDTLAVGIIDDDKKKDKYFDEFNVVENHAHYRYLSHPNGIHFIIAVKGGGIEKLIIACAAEVGLQHSLLEDFEQLKHKTKSMDEDPDVRKIINELIRMESATLMRIQEILRLHLRP